ncbi:hypothetical protein [Tenuibacillus multivorans]|uniref:Prenyltransferase and squalene oxidase repeat-containing protein n=1 Tax=Tenuibacillus multivorans TaxID=237069 RepID=A0A1G9WM79_9BACI|nr:hypothetical protein [Tenuibacillus multivorans]GEL78017.1 hypothetical protein TMU01_22520 [Tenuibacillus multivorans]SDM85363.1 hypothetical protein SAMN05216498_0798 [Tenuibacillus multivorans]
MKISNQTFQKSSAWVKRNARSLDVARWEYFFENGTKEQVIKYLSAFQNDDGGFGHGIEPDFWTPQSSPMSTWAAGQILMDIEADKNDKIVQSMVDYLTKTYHEDSGMWDSAIPENNDHPHAPWWGWDEDVQKNWMFNPSAELAAFLVHWSEVESEASQIGWASIEKAVDHLMASDEMDHHEINNFQQLVRIVEPYEETFNAKLAYTYEDVTEKVMSLAEICVEKDPSKWATDYLPLPLDFISGPDDALYERMEALVEQNINFYLERITDEGIWDISWDWGMYPEEYSIARRYWQGILTVDRYKALKTFGWL